MADETEPLNPLAELVEALHPLAPVRTVPSQTLPPGWTFEKTTYPPVAPGDRALVEYVVRRDGAILMHVITECLEC